MKSNALTVIKKYIGETGKRIEERFKEHAEKDHRSYVLKHTLESGHSDNTFQNLKVVNNNYANYYKRKVSEAFYHKIKKIFFKHPGKKHISCQKSRGTLSWILKIRSFWPHYIVENFSILCDVIEKYSTYFSRYLGLNFGIL